MSDRDSELLKAIFDRLDRTENNLKEEIKELKNFNESLVEKFNEVERIVIDQQKVILDLKQQLNRRNIIIHGIQPSVEEDNLEPTVVEMLNNKLNLTITADKIEQVYRLGKNDGRKTLPIKVEFANYKDKMKVIKSKAMLRGSRIFINDDLPKELRIRAMEERKERRERSERSERILSQTNKRVLREQSSEETENEVQRITQEVKRLRERGRYVSPELGLDNNQKNA